MSSIHGCSSIQNSFTALKILSALPIRLPLPHPYQTLANIDLFTVSLVLSFPKCHVVRIIRYVAFSDGLILAFSICLQCATFPK